MKLNSLGTLRIQIALALACVFLVASVLAGRQQANYHALSGTTTAIDAPIATNTVCSPLTATEQESQQVYFVGCGGFF